MSASSPVPTDHPLMKAWTAYKATDDYANTKRWAGLYSEATDGSLWAAFERGWLAAGGRPPFAEPPAAPPTGEAGTANHQRNIITAALKRCHRLLEQAVGHVNPEEDPALVDAIQAELMPCDEANICPALAAPVPAAPPDLVELVRRVIAAHTKETVTRAAWADKTEPWSPESGQMFEAVLAREAETREAFSALAAYPLTPKEDTNG
jgi:hypothetical protein